MAITPTTILSAGLSTPVNAAFSTASTGGSLPPATYYYRVSALYGTGGETLASTETSQVVGAGTSTNTVTVNWAAVTGATGYKVYGRTTGAELLIATVGAVTTYTDTGSITPAGALPASNSTGTAVATATFDVVQGAQVTLGAYVASGLMPANVYLRIYQLTPGADKEFAQIGRGDKPISVTACGTYRVTRDDITAQGVNVGAYTYP